MLLPPGPDGEENQRDGHREFWLERTRAGGAENYPFTVALAIFAVAALTTSQSASTRTMVPLGLALGIGGGYMIAMWTAVVGVLLLCLRVVSLKRRTGQHDR